MANNYNIMAEYIVSKYIERISGDDINETFVDESPADRVMVGMLAQDRVDRSFSGGYVENNNTRFESVPSISISFIVEKNARGRLQVVPSGLLFYSVEPDFEKTVDYIIQKYSEKDNVPYSDIMKLCECYPEEKFYLPLTYKRVRIEDEMGEGIAIDLAALTEKKFHLEDEIAQKLSVLANRISSEICITQCDRITFFDLTNEERFRVVTGSREERVLPRWGIDIYCNVSDEGDNYRFLLQMVNKTPVENTAYVGYLPQIFNAGMTVIGNEHVEFQEIELNYFKSSYKKREPVYVVAENTSAYYEKNSNAIVTDNIPKYFQKRLKTKDNYNEYVTFDKLIEDPVGKLTFVFNEMRNDFCECEQEFRSARFETVTAKERFREALEEYDREINRFKKGIDQIEYKDNVKKAFIYMNKTFQTKLSGEHRNISGWRLFQIVFIVSMICEMIRSEYKDDRRISEADIDIRVSRRFE